MDLLGWVPSPTIGLLNELMSAWTTDELFVSLMGGWTHWWVLGAAVMGYRTCCDGWLDPLVSAWTCCDGLLDLLCWVLGPTNGCLDLLMDAWSCCDGLLDLL